MHALKIFLVVLSVAASAFIAACGGGAATNTGPAPVTSGTITVSTQLSGTPIEDRPEMAKQAVPKDVYALNCMICHKDNGEGGKVTVQGKSLNAENLTEDKFKNMTDERLIGYVTNGIPDEGMPAFKGKLTEDEIKSAVAHVRALQGLK